MWDEIDDEVMPAEYDQAIMTIESPNLCPVVGILSKEDEGRSKKFFTYILRDSIIRPCNYPVIILSPVEELLRSLKITTICGFAPKEIFKISNTFPAALTGSRADRSTCPSSKDKFFLTMIYSKFHHLIEIYELDAIGQGCAIAIIPRVSLARMSETDELFLAVSTKIRTAFFSEDVEKWSRKVDRESVTQRISRIWEAEDESNESMCITLLETRCMGDGWRFIWWLEVPFARRMAEYMSSPEDHNDRMTEFSSCGEEPGEWWRRALGGTFFTESRRLSSSSSLVYSVSRGSYTQMSPPLLNSSETEVLDMSAEAAHQEIFVLKLRLKSTTKDLRELHKERLSHLKLITSLQNQRQQDLPQRVVTRGYPSFDDGPTSSKDSSSSITKRVNQLAENIVSLHKQECAKKRKRDESLDVRQRLGPMTKVARSPFSSPASKSPEVVLLDDLKTPSLKKKPVIIDIESSSTDSSSEKLVEEKVRKSPIQPRQESKRDLLSKRKQIRFSDADNFLDTPVKKETLTETEENYKTVINSLSVRKDPVFKGKGKGKGKSPKMNFLNLKEIPCDSLPPVKTPERPKPLMSAYL